MTTEAKDHFGQDINVDDRVLFVTSHNNFAWGRVVKVTPKMLSVNYERAAGKVWNNTTMKFHKDVVVIGEDLKQTIAIHKLSS